MKIGVCMKICVCKSLRPPSILDNHMTHELPMDILLTNYKLKFQAVDSRNSHVLTQVSALKKLFD